MQKTSIIKSLVLAGLVTLSNLAAAEIVVIVNPKSPLASMTPEQVSAIFMGKTNTLPSGTTAAPADLPEGNAARDQFYSKAAGKSSSQVKATWARQGAVPMSMTVGEFDKYLQADITNWANIVKVSGAKPD